MNTGDVTENIEVGLPQLHSAFTDNKTIVVSGSGGTSTEGTHFTFAPGSETMTLIDNLNPPENVLWSDSLTTTNDSVNWTLTFQNSNTPPIVIPNYPNYAAGTQPSPGDYDVEFGYPIANDVVGQSPTMVANGWTNALKVTVNKNPGGASAGVNLYPQGMKFSGNYALRFSMNLTEGSFNTTEYNTFGINSYGTNVDWFAADLKVGEGTTTTNMDGVWYGVDADTDGNGASAGIWLVAGQPASQCRNCRGYLGASGNCGSFELYRRLQKPGRLQRGSARRAFGWRWLCCQHLGRRRGQTIQQRRHALHQQDGDADLHKH